MAIHKMPGAVFHAAITSASSGQNAVVAAAAGYFYRVLSYILANSGASVVDVKWQSASTDLTGLIPLPVDGGHTAVPNDDGWFDTAVNEALNLNLSGAVQTGGVVVYQKIAARATVGTAP